MVEILNGPSISKHDKPKKLIFLLHGYGDNAANFMHLAHPIDQDDWEAQYVALNGPGYITGNLMGYQWFDLDSEKEEIILEKSLVAEEKLSKFIDEVIDNLQKKLVSGNLSIPDGLKRESFIDD